VGKSAAEVAVGDERKMSVPARTSSVAEKGGICLGKGDQKRIQGVIILRENRL